MNLRHSYRVRCPNSSLRKSHPVSFFRVVCSYKSYLFVRVLQKEGTDGENCGYTGANLYYIY
jgi:hypothetical protein